MIIGRSTKTLPSSDYACHQTEFLMARGHHIVTAQAFNESESDPAFNFPVSFNAHHYASLQALQNYISIFNKITFKLEGRWNLIPYT